MDDPNSRASSIPSFARRLALFGLFAFAATLPHSIALAQISAGLMLFGWLVMTAGRAVGGLSRGRQVLAGKPVAGGVSDPEPEARWRPEKFRWRTPWTWPLLCFVLWSLLSSVLSYEPRISLDKLRSVGLFIIFFLVLNLVRSERMVRAIMLVLVCSCLLNVGYVYAMKVRGRGMEILAISPASPLQAGGLQAGDVILRAAGHDISDLRDLTEAAERLPNQALQIFVFRPEVYFYRTVPVPAGGWLANQDWGLRTRRWRNFRAAGFYGWNYFTYAEVVQLIGSIALALALSAGGWQVWLWSPATLAIGGAIALTLTRAVWGAFAVSVGLIILRGGKKRVLVAAIVLAIVLAPFALKEMRRARGISPIQPNEPSASYRLAIWGEGWRLLWSRPRHVLVGVGMDSIKLRWREWDMFQGGQLPVGHMHSTPLQLALERGVPALAFWIWWFGAYMKKLWIRTRAGPRQSPTGTFALSLGALGGTAGFLISSLVHYNFGDSEVIMVVYLVMGLVAADDLHRPSLCDHDAGAYTLSREIPMIC